MSEFTFSSFSSGRRGTVRQDPTRMENLAPEDRPSATGTGAAQRSGHSRHGSGSGPQVPFQRGHSRQGSGSGSRVSFEGGEPGPASVEGMDVDDNRRR